MNAKRLADPHGAFVNGRPSAPPSSSRFAGDHDTECGASSELVPGFGYLYCELVPGHEGPHREREDGHVWDAAPPA